MGLFACEPFAIVSDPDAARRWTATEIVKTFGYIVHPAHTPGEALEIILNMGGDHPLLRTGHPLLVMSVDDEAEVSRALAALAHDFCPGIRVVIATDHAVPRMPELDGCISRDFTGAELRDAIRIACASPVRHERPRHHRGGAELHFAGHGQPQG
jgi:hypothetical protein